MSTRSLAGSHGATRGMGRSLTAKKAVAISGGSATSGLFFASSHTHPDETIELDFDEKAGIDPTVDDEEVQRAANSRIAEAASAVRRAFASVLNLQRGASGFKRRRTRVVCSSGEPEVTSRGY